MTKFIIRIFLIIFFLCALLNAGGNKNSAHTHYCMVLYGKNHLYFDSINSHQNISIVYNPLPNIKGFGLNAWYTWYIQHDNPLYYEYKASLIVVQPSTHLLHKSLALKLGINLIYISEGEDRGILAWLPAAEIRYKIMSNLYLSAGYRSDMFFGRLTANLHFMFNDNVSEIMFGYTYKKDWDEDYNGLTYKIDYMLFKKFLLRVLGNANFARKLYGTQIGIGMLL